MYYVAFLELIRVNDSEASLSHCDRQDVIDIVGLAVEQGHQYELAVFGVDEVLGLAYLSIRRKYALERVRRDRLDTLTVACGSSGQCAEDYGICPCILSQD